MSSPAGVTIFLPGGTKTSRLFDVSAGCTACTQCDEVPASFKVFKEVGRASIDALLQWGSSSHIAERAASLSESHREGKCGTRMEKHIYENADGAQK